jgi:uncharacterized protein (DUF2252 family)
VLRASLLAAVLAACGDDPRSARELRVIETLAQDNRAYAERDRELVELKLVKMQRSTYDWMRGTSAVYWRDVNDGVLVSSFDLSPVLLVGDPHPENLGTFRAADGTMLADWNDFDAAGYGPFTADVRRLAVGLILATNGDKSDDLELAARVAQGYASEIDALAHGAPPFELRAGMHPLIDDELARAEGQGLARAALVELAPGGALAVGDLEERAEDGVYEDTVREVSAAELAMIDAAIARWASARGETVSVKLRARRIGPGVSSYPALRYNVVLADDRLLELKEERDTPVPGGAPEQSAPEWTSPASRVANTQRRLQARPDADAQLGSAELPGASLRLRDREAFQRNFSRASISALSRGEERQLAELMGRRLASAHGAALGPDGVQGWIVISNAIAVGGGGQLAAEIADSAVAEAKQTRDDFHAFEHVDDLAALVLP